MFRALIVPILIAGLLLCPLRCAIGAAVIGPDAASVVGGTTIVSAAGGCSCCVPAAVTRAAAEGKRAAEASGLPAGCPAEGCGCSSCICAGAILECDGDLLHVTLDDVATAPCGWQSPIDVLHHGALYLPTLLASPGPLLNGRAARIAHQSLLI